MKNSRDKPVIVSIVYPSDPLGIIPGGIDTCIRDIIRCAPNDIHIQIIGVSTNKSARPPLQWHNCDLEGRTFKFYPVMAVSNLEQQMRIPLSLQFTLRLIRHMKALANSDIIQFHRIEPALVLLHLKQPKLLIIHQNMNVLRNAKSDIRWKYAPGLYFQIENAIISRMKGVFIVREDAVKDYQERFPDKKKSIQFLPTWMNPDLFYPLNADEKRMSAARQLHEIGGRPDDKLIVFVGRLDHQKDPLYLINSLALLEGTRSDWQVIIIGDGVLRSEVEQLSLKKGLNSKVHLLGAKAQTEVAEFLRTADLMVLSSVYEGMPRCVVEALGCGVPVVTTKAGEVTLLIEQGKNGYIVEEKDTALFAKYINKTLDDLAEMGGDPCLKAVEKYQANAVLEKVYETYRDYSNH